jgi:hypothetical protein
MDLIWATFEVCFAESEQPRRVLYNHSTTLNLIACPPPGAKLISRVVE